MARNMGNFGGGHGEGAALFARGTKGAPRREDEAPRVPDACVGLLVVEPLRLLGMGQLLGVEDVEHLVLVGAEVLLRCGDHDDVVALAGERVLPVAVDRVDRLGLA